MGTLAVAVSERVKVSSADALVKRQTARVDEHVVVAPTFHRTWTLRAAIRDVVRLRSRTAIGSILHVALASTVRVGTRLSTAARVTLHSGVRLRSSVLVKQGVTLVERMALSARPTGLGTYHAKVTSRVRLTDHLPGMRLGALLRDIVHVGAELLGLRQAVAKVAEHIEVTAVAGFKLQLLVFQTDTVELTDDTLLRAIYNGVLSDTIDFIIDVVDPGGDVTTWAMNVRTGAVTEYLNYAFNSFTQTANGTHLAAGPDGLFELVGKDDDGTPIPADLIGGLVDFSGPFLSTLQAVYLGVRGNGDYFLKLTQGDGARSVVYKVAAQSLKTARINVGKGWRARYFTWELVTTGQDFDLLDLNFLPIQATRRV